MTMTLPSDPPADVRPVPARLVPIEAAADGAPVASVDGRELAGTAEASRWRRISLSRGGVLLRLEDETVVNCRATPDEARHTLDLTCPGTHQRGSLQRTREGKQLRLDGSFAGKPVAARLALRDDARLPLVRAQFRWTYE